MKTNMDMFWGRHEIGNVNNKYVLRLTYLKMQWIGNDKKKDG
jgi:hypothetical protein